MAHGFRSALLLTVLIALAAETSCGPGVLPLEQEILVEATRGARPAWLDAPGPSTDKVLRAVGRAGASSVEGGKRRALVDGVGEIVDFFYARLIHASFRTDEGVGPASDEPFAEFQDETAMREVRNRIVDRATQAGTDRPVVPVVAKTYWERWRIPNPDGTSYETYRVFLLLEVPRNAMDAAVATWIGATPSVMAAHDLEREASFVILEIKRRVGQGVASIEANRLADVATHARRVQQLTGDLEDKVSRYEKATGRRLPLDVDGARRQAARLLRLATRAMGSVKLSVSVSVYPAARRHLESTVHLVLSQCRALGIAATRSAGAPCDGGATHWLSARIDVPTCIHPDRGFNCELPMTLSMGHCPASHPTATLRVPGLFTRGEAKKKRRAVLRAWTDLAGDHHPGLLRSFDELLSPHFPTLLPTGQP